MRTYALGAIASFHCLEGRYDASLAARRQVVHEATQGFGPTHNETVQSLNDVVMEARNAGRLLEADRALQELLAATRTHTLRSLVRANVLFMAATLDIDLGRYESARRQLLALIAEAPGANGPPLHDRWQSRPGDQLINMHRMLAKVLFLQGNPLAARQAADAAVEMARPEQPRIAGLYARLIRTQVLSVLEKPEGALNDVESVIKGLRDIGQAADAGPVLFALQLRGELLARSGLLSRAREELEAVVQALAKSAQPDPIQQAQALDQLGTVLRALGQPGQARARHEQAGSLLHSALPAEHPLLARNALYREAARMEAGEGEDRQDVLQQAGRYKALFPPESIWRRLVDRYLETVHTRPGPLAGSLLLL